MKKQIGSEELYRALQELIDWEALEYQVLENEHQGRGCVPQNNEHQGRGFVSPGPDVLISYLMNDAAEYYICLRQCRIEGSINPETAGLCLETDPQGEWIRFVEPDGTSMTIFYEEAISEEHNYQYHRIGHHWRKTPGQEAWRRLVNLICVLHDKYTYLGADVCNPIEESLYRLVEFGPFCYFTPINDPISDWYPETKAGINAMLALALEAGDFAMVDMVRDYKHLAEGIEKENSFWEIVSALQEAEHERIFWLLQEKIEAASLWWEPRQYPKEQERMMQEARAAMEEKYREMGYVGEYPMMEKDKKVLFVEEHPFTVMESEEYKFHIYAIEI